MSKLLKLSLYGEGKILINAEHITKIIQSEFNESTTIIKIAGSDLDEVVVTESIEEIEALTLRDQFAMSAMSGLLANNSIDDIGAKGIAHDAYLFADAMLKARKE